LGEQVNLCPKSRKKERQNVGDVKGAEYLFPLGETMDRPHKGEAQETKRKKNKKRVYPKKEKDDPGKEEKSCKSYPVEGRGRVQRKWTRKRKKKKKKTGLPEKEDLPPHAFRKTRQETKERKPWREESISD